MIQVLYIFDYFSKKVMPINQPIVITIENALNFQSAELSLQ